MEDSNYSGWNCDICDIEFTWDESVVVISGGIIVQESNGPVVDKDPWWGVYHISCYERRELIDPIDEATSN